MAISRRSKIRCCLVKISVIFFILYLAQYFLVHIMVRFRSSYGLIRAVVATKQHGGTAKYEQFRGSPGHSVSSAETLPRLESMVIRLCTYNLWGHYFVGNLSDYEERFETFAESVEIFDVVLVQEIFLLRVGPLLFSKYAENLVRKMEARGFRYRSDLRASLPIIFGQSSGVVIFSRIPVLSTKAEVFRDWGWIEGATNKGYAYVELSLNGHQLFIFNLHLDAHKIKTRERQLLQVLSTYQLLSTTSFLVIGGDFNLDAPKASTSVFSKEYQRIRRLAARWNLQLVFPERPITIPKEQSNTDQIIVSSNVKIRDRKVEQLFTNKGEMVSDHFGLSATLELRLQ